MQSFTAFVTHTMCERSYMKSHMKSTHVPPENFEVVEIHSTAREDCQANSDLEAVRKRLASGIQNNIC